MARYSPAAPAHDPTGRARSRGRILLLEVLQTRTAASIAQAIDVHPSTISRLASGEQFTDSYRLRMKIQHGTDGRVLASAWDEPA